MRHSRVDIDAGAMRDLQRELATSGYRALAEECMARAVAETPVLTGRLRDGMYAAVYVDGSLVWSLGPVPSVVALDRRGIEVLVGNDVEYARFVHDGTSDTSQHPFLASALSLAQVRGPDIVAGGIR